MVVRCKAVVMGMLAGDTADMGAVGDVQHLTPRFDSLLTTVNLQWIRCTQVYQTCYMQAPVLSNSFARQPTYSGQCQKQQGA
jgi:hypothetical protein